METPMRAGTLNALFLLSLACVSASTFGAGAASAEETKFKLYPVFSYSPETGLAGGLGAAIAIPAHGPGAGGAGPAVSDEGPGSVSGEGRPGASGGGRGGISSGGPASVAAGRFWRIRTSVVFTSEEQSLAELSVLTPPTRKGFRFSGGAGYRKYPFDFYGIGNDTGDEPVGVVQESAGAGLSAGKSFGHGLSLWFRYRYSDDGIDWRGSPPPVVPPAGDPVPGSEGGFLSGVGLSLSWDRRDGVNSRRSGYALMAGASAYERSLGSDYEFTRLTVDARAYVPVILSQVLAVQLYGAFSGGEPPFYELPRLGGMYLLRGYYEGRFSDRQLAALQAEYRVPVFGRFGTAFFGGAGQVADTLSGFSLSGLKWSWGFGLRITLDRRTRVPMRLDFGFGEDSRGIYLTVFEAF